ncbi:MAG: glycosyltransferase [Candidatus Woesearchaeota archaeon]
MVLDNLMFLSGFILLILFIFLLVNNLVIVISWFKKDKRYNFKPFISVIIPAYNEEKNIVNCIKSVKASNYPQEKLEIIVVDDGSTDKTVKLAKKLGVKILKLNHKGKPNALNEGIKKSKHDFVLTIDADTVLDKDCIKNIVFPFKESDVGATTGTNKIQKKSNLLEYFQHVEYSYNNLIRKAFSVVFKEGIWFYGAVACYRKSVMEKINYFSQTSLTEDMDILFKIQSINMKTKHAFDAYSFTIAPNSIKAFIKQRIRWWSGVLQAMKINRAVLKKRKTVPLFFIYISQWWWSIFSFIAIPLFLLQIFYWLPYNLESFMMTFGYFFRWFSFAGPLYVIYMIPVWGLSFYSLFGVLSGIISVTFILISFYTFSDKIRFMDALAVFFYFPFTILLNIAIMLGVLSYSVNKTGVFKK